MADKKAVEIEDLSKIVAVSDPRVSPDGDRAIFVHTVMDFETDEYTNTLWMADLKRGKATKYTTGRGKDKNPLWSPDGKQILFTSTPPVKEGEEKKKTQLYIISTEGGEARQVTDLETPVESPQWSPNGKNVLFVSGVRDEEPESDVKVITRLYYKANAGGFFDGKRKHLFRVPARGGKPKQITKGDFDVSTPRWLPDNRRIVFVGNMREDADKTKHRFVYVVDSKTGEVTMVTDQVKSIRNIRPSPEGKAIAVTGHDYEKGSPTFSNVWLVPLDGGDHLNLTGGHDMNIGSGLSCEVKVNSPDSNPQWSADGKYLYFTSIYDGAARLYRVPVEGGPVEEVVGGLNHSVLAFDLMKGGEVVYTHLNTTDLSELWVYRNGKSRQLTDFNKSYLGKTAVQDHEEFRFKSNGGHMVEGWIMKPYPYKEGEKYPLILHIHGGPTGVYGNAFFHEFQVLAAQGWAVMYINPWGSGGYYEEYQTNLPGHYFEQDYDDLMKAVDYVVENYDYVDGKRLGVTGGSYGGVMSNWIITQTDRFNAAITCRSITNWLTFFGVSDIGWTFLQHQLHGIPWLDEEKLMEKSPIRHVANVKTPTMIIQSEQDYRCPMEQAEQLYTALKFLGVESEFIRFPNETHELSRSGKPKHRRERLQHMVRWFNKYL